jgi:sarcosine oxidase, subunit gamma
LLASMGLPVPSKPNGFVVREMLQGGTLRILRLGSTELLVEQEGGRTVLDALVAATPGTRAHHAPRCDFSVVLNGEDLFRQLSRLCACDFATLEREPDRVVMTLLAGISVIVVSEPTANGTAALRLWCDPGFGNYLTHCLAHMGEPR